MPQQGRKVHNSFPAESLRPRLAFDRSQRIGQPKTNPALQRPSKPPKTAQSNVLSPFHLKGSIKRSDLECTATLNSIFLNNIRVASCLQNFPKSTFYIQKLNIEAVIASLKKRCHVVIPYLPAVGDKLLYLVIAAPIRIPPRTLHEINTPYYCINLHQLIRGVNEFHFFLVS